MLKKIEFTNYRLYQNKTVEFDKGLNVIQGRNGTGKSTIVEGIAYGLQGSSVQKGKNNSWITEGESSGGVTLWLDEYIIHRHTSKQVVEDLNGNVLARGHTGINQWVESVYGLTPELFKTSFYIEQKDVDSFSGLSPMERTKRVEKLLRVDVLDDIKKAVNETLKYTKIEAANLQARLREAIYTEEEIETLKNRIDSLGFEIAQSEDSFAELLRLDGIYQEQVTKWERKKALLAKLETSETLESIESILTDYDSKFKLAIKASENNKLAKEKDSLEKKLAGVNILAKYFKYSISEVMDHKNIVKSNEKLAKQLESYVDVEAKEVSSLASMKKDLVELEYEIDNLKKSPDVCKSCGQKLPDLIKTKAKLKKLEEEHALAKAELTKCTRQWEKYTLEHQIQELKLDLKDPIDDIVASIELKPYVERLEELKDIKFIDSLPLEHIERELSYWRAQQSTIITLKEYESITEEPVAVELKSARASLQYLKDTLASVTKQLETQEKAKAIYEQYHKDYLAKEANAVLYSRLVKFIDLYRKEFSDNIVPLLNENVSKIMSYLTEGKYPEVVINKDYSIENYDRYSGSEEDSVNFAIRLAIAQISRLGNFNSMILDEIAASFDNVKENLLLDVLKSTDMQLIYISHGQID